MSKIKTKTLKNFGQGFTLGIVGISSFYYLLLFVVTGDIKHPLTQFSQFQPWMSLLFFGFGIQMGLFWLMRKGVHFNLQEKSDANMAAGTSGTVSGVTMIACCTHHVVDILPVLGLSAAVLFLTQYQEQLLIIGVFSNLFGITWMLWLITGKPQAISLIRLLKFRRIT